MHMTDEIKQYILQTFGEDMLAQIEQRANDLAQQAKAIASTGVRFKSDDRQTQKTARRFWGFDTKEPQHAADDRQTMASHYSAQNSQYDPMWPGMRIPAQNAKKQAIRGKNDTFWLIPTTAQSKTLAPDTRRDQLARLNSSIQALESGSSQAVETIVSEFRDLIAQLQQRTDDFQQQINAANQAMRDDDFTGAAGHVTEIRDMLAGDKNRVKSKAKSTMPWAQNHTPQPPQKPPAQKSVGLALKDLRHGDKILVRKTLSAVFGSQRSTALITEYWDSPDGLAAIVSLLDRLSLRRDN